MVAEEEEEKENTQTRGMLPLRLQQLAVANTPKNTARSGFPPKINKYIIIIPHSGDNNKQALQLTNSTASVKQHQQTFLKPHCSAKWQIVQV